MDFIGVEVCGTGVNDTDPTNAAGSCLKVVENDGMLFTSSPSVALLDTLGYVQASNQSEKTYANTIEEDGTYGPAGFFGRFNQLLVNGDDDSAILAEGVNGQYDRWCKKLGGVSFNGRTDWRRVASHELVGLIAANGAYVYGFWLAGGL